MDIMVDKDVSSKVIRVLLVEDDDDDYFFTDAMLHEAPLLKFELDRVADCDSALKAMRQACHDLYLVDYQLGKKDGLDLIREAVANGCAAPIILLTGLDSQDVDVEAMQAGATDYLIKGQITAQLLERAIRYAIATQGHLMAERDAKRQLEQANSRLVELYDTAHGFVDNVSHEFRTPLTVIKEYASIMREGLGGEISAQQNEFLSVILDRVDDLRLLVDDMLDISRIESGLLGIARRETRFADIVDHIRPILDRKALSSNGRLTVDLATDLPPLFCDPEKIGRVIINLVVNAFKFADDDGEVRLSARAERSGRSVLISVADNGPGIPEDQLRIIFDRFKQLHGPRRNSGRGFGLGLNIAKELVQVNLGDISVDSAVGKGSTFHFTVPAFDPPEILARYLGQQTAPSHDQTCFTLLAISATGAGLSKSAMSTEDQLQDQLRWSDLLIQPSPGRWLLLVKDRAAAGNGVADELLRSIGADDPSGDADHHRSVIVDEVGTWAWPADSAAIKAAFSAVCDGMTMGRDAAGGTAAWDAAYASLGDPATTPRQVFH